MERYLHPFRDEIYSYCSRERDIIDQAILLWRVIYSVVHQYRQVHPSWRFLRLEDLAADPLGCFRSLYRALGLTWDLGVERKIAEFSRAEGGGEVSPEDHQTIRRDSQAAIMTWATRLTREEIERVRRGTSDVSQWYYTTQEWQYD